MNQLILFEGMKLGKDAVLDAFSYGKFVVLGMKAA